MPLHKQLIEIRIAFFVTGMQGWTPAPVVARVNGSEITGNTYEVTLTDIEYL